MILEDYGYSTENILIPGLNIQVMLGKNRYFRNDGVVADLHEHTDRIFEELNAINPHKRDNEEHYGRTVKLDLEVRKISVKASIIFILEQQSLPDAIFNTGHESVHALIHLGKEQYLIESLENLGFFFDPFQVYDDEESVANVGGFLSLYRANPLTFEQFHIPEIEHIKREFWRSKK